MPQAPAKDRSFAPDDPALHPGWDLMGFLLSLKADEFSIRFMHAGETGKQHCDELLGKLSGYSLGMANRECSVTYAHEGNPRFVDVWRLNPMSLRALQEVMPDGILGTSHFASAWAEDLCVYRVGELIFSSVTHERIAVVRMTDSEWLQWQRRPTAKLPYEQ